MKGQLNARQDKAIARMFREGIDGFKGGMSADNYITITGASRATATRDLQDLVTKGALKHSARHHARHAQKKALLLLTDDTLGKEHDEPAPLAILVRRRPPQMKPQRHQDFAQLCTLPHRDVVPSAGALLDDIACSFTN